jgi:4-diphosphocytidyl-2-C-methyl-D-erythritol kinase
MHAPVTEKAFAKINLYLHVLGKRSDGYHRLDSLIAFADIADEVTIIPADGFSFSIKGPFADRLPHQDNLVIRAAHKLCERIGRAPDMHVTLTKNLPVGAGIGGGSADAAATIRGALRFFETQAHVDDILLDLGADTPACYYSKPLRIGEIGEEIELLREFPATPALLVNPLIHCPTPGVFQALRNVSHGDKCAVPDTANKNGLFRYLELTRNDLTEAAISIVPEIEKVLDALAQTDAAIVRMSGSGATCFALYKDEETCRAAGAILIDRHPPWWVRATQLRPAP